MNKQAHIYFSGSVQGVGFRFVVRNLAEKSTVSGWVRNLSDGRVEIVAEAEDDILRDFISAIEDDFSGYIKDRDVEWNEYSGVFKDFSIRF